METELEQRLTHTHKFGLIAFIKDHPECIEELLVLAISDKPPYSWRASWLVWSIMEPNDNRIQPFLPQMVNILPHRKENQQRELMMILQRMDLDEDLEGLLFGHCCKIWEQTRLQPSIRVNAIRLLVKIVKNHPELRPELQFLTQPQFLNTLSKGVKWSVEKLLQKI